MRVGRQLINYNNTIMANSEWRNQARSYDAVVANLHYDRFRLGIFAASAVIPMDEGISHHQEGNNIYGDVWQHRQILADVGSSSRLSSGASIPVSRLRPRKNNSRP